MDARIRVTGPYRLDRTLSCGQAFRWHWEGTAARGIFTGRRVRIVQKRDGIRVEGLLDGQQIQSLRRYLGVDQPLGIIEDALRADHVLKRILPHTTGIALMRQDPWECLVSFVISAFNNIPKIELTLDRLCRRFGTSVDGAVRLFPSSAAIAGADLTELRSCLLGYRAPYVLGVAKRVEGGDFDLSALAERSYEEARGRLLTLPGVGAKVADCVLLFAYGKTEAFPVDVWVKRAVERLYFRGRQKTEGHIRAWAQEQFGLLAGYAQQHLYYYIRERGTGNGERRKIRSERPSASLGSGRRRRR